MPLPFYNRFGPSHMSMGSGLQERCSFFVEPVIAGHMECAAAVAEVGVRVRAILQKPLDRREAMRFAKGMKQRRETAVIWRVEPLCLAAFCQVLERQEGTIGSSVVGDGQLGINQVGRCPGTQRDQELGGGILSVAQRRVNWCPARSFDMVIVGFIVFVPEFSAL